MDDEETFDDESEEYDDMTDKFADVMGERQASRHEKLQGKNKRALARFLGKGARAVQAGVVPSYYGGLLIWALKRVIEAEGWEIIKTLGYHTSQPIFIDVQTDYQKNENLLQDGQMLLKKGELRLIVTVSCAGATSNSVLVEGDKANEQSVKDFTEAIEKYAVEHNFYRGKRIEFSGMLALLDVEPRLWDSIVLDDEIKDEICATQWISCANAHGWKSMASRRGEVSCWPGSPALARPSFAVRLCLRQMVSPASPPTPIY